ncbi:MAG: 5-(carboxyamino)imidazole ribonucleotide mutase [Bacteroides sp.]|nr:5-(carboxyamino)imidazole ribonucleotide mutase [Bacteroides sp.]
MEKQRPATDHPLVSLIMGSTSDYPIMEAAAKFLNEQQVPFEILAFSAHRTPMEVIDFAQNAEQRGVRVIIAAAGMAAHLPGVIAALTPLPVIGVPIKSSIEGIDAAFAILQMPPGIPVATMAINGALNAAILALQILSVGTDDTAVYYRTKVMAHKKSLKEKIKKANEDLKNMDFEYRIK